MHKTLSTSVGRDVVEQHVSNYVDDVSDSDVKKYSQFYNICGKNHVSASMMFLSWKLEKQSTVSNTVTSTVASILGTLFDRSVLTSGLEKLEAIKPYSPKRNVADKTAHQTEARSTKRARPDPLTNLPPISDTGLPDQKLAPPSNANTINSHVAPAAAPTPHDSLDEDVVETPPDEKDINEDAAVDSEGDDPSFEPEDEGDSSNSDEDEDDDDDSILSTDNYKERKRGATKATLIHDRWLDGGDLESLVNSAFAHLSESALAVRTPEGTTVSLRKARQKRPCVHGYISNKLEVKTLTGCSAGLEELVKYIKIGRELAKKSGMKHPVVSADEVIRILRRREASQAHKNDASGNLSHRQKLEESEVAALRKLLGVPGNCEIKMVRYKHNVTVFVDEKKRNLGKIVIMTSGRYLCDLEGSSLTPTDGMYYDTRELGDKATLSQLCRYSDMELKRSCAPGMFVAMEMK